MLAMSVSSEFPKGEFGSSMRNSNVQKKICKMMFEYNQELSELYIATKNDIRCIDLYTGKINKILANIVEPGSEITMIKLYFDNKHFLIGTSQGDLKLFSCNDGKFKAKLFSHTSDISGLEYDEKNHLVISAGWDSKIMVQKEKLEHPIRVQK